MSEASAFKARASRRLSQAHGALLAASARVAELEKALGESLAVMENPILTPMTTIEAATIRRRLSLILSSGPSQWEDDPEIDWDGIER